MESCCPARKKKAKAATQLNVLLKKYFRVRRSIADSVFYLQPALSTPNSVMALRY
jgi:hypothetical protein